MPNLEDINNKLKSKGPRLLIVGADSCNNLAPRPSIEINEEKFLLKDQLYDMFRNYRGNILITSAKPGEFSFYRDHSLGYFTKQLLNALTSASGGASGEIWNTLLARATSVIDIPPHKQLPDESPMQKQQHPIFRKELTR